MKENDISTKTFKIVNIWSEVIWQDRFLT